MSASRSDLDRIKAPSKTDIKPSASDTGSTAARGRIEKYSLDRAETGAAPVDRKPREGEQGATCSAEDDGSGSVWHLSPDFIAGAIV